jgi:hypothetical protein
MLSNLEKFHNTWSYKELVKKHSLDSVGLWEILGEDTNPDWAGTHVMPTLCHVTGKLSDVIETAVDLPGFWAWGGGGDIRLIKIVSLHDLKAQTALLNEKKALEQKIKHIDAALNIK